MKALYFSIVCFFLLGGNVSGQGIRFFEGSLDQALEVLRKKVNSCLLISMRTGVDHVNN